MNFKSLSEIGLDNLPRYSNWPGSLLDGVVRRRPKSKVRREYEEKYERLFDYAKDGLRSWSAVRAFELGHRKVAMCYGNRLYEATLADAMEVQTNLFLRYLRPEALLTGSVVDLGCGYGYLLHRLQSSTKSRKEIKFAGGELTKSGIRLAHLLGPELGVEPFDFLSDQALGGPLDNASTPPSVVATCYALHQLPSARPAVELLSRHREKIAMVVSLEPEGAHFGDGLLGRLRHRYEKLCGYSANLVQVLESRDDVDVDIVDPAIVGVNALLPATLTIWRFK